MTTRIKLIGGLLVVIWLAVLTIVVLLALNVAPAHAAPSVSVRVGPSPSISSDRAAATCAAATWQARTVYEGRPVWVQVSRSTTCRYRITRQ